MQTDTKVSPYLQQLREVVRMDPALSQSKWLSEAVRQLDNRDAAQAFADAHTLLVLCAQRVNDIRADAVRGIQHYVAASLGRRGSVWPPKPQPQTDITLVLPPKVERELRDYMNAGGAIFTVR